GHTDQRVRCPARRYTTWRRVRIEDVLARQSGGIRPDCDRKTLGVQHGACRGVLRHARDPKDRAGSRFRQLLLVVDHRRDCEEHSVSDAEIRVMIITRKAIDRRTILRGVGAAITLPLLDSMVPALTALGRTAAKPIRRFGAVYVPNGIVM